MSQTHIGPDGKPHVFPDDASPDEIDSAMQQEYSSPSQGEGGPETFTPVSPDPYGIGDIERQRREMVGQHGIASNPGLVPQSVAPMAPQPQGVAPDARKDFLQSWLGQTAQGALETVASIPGAPIDAAHGIANFTRRQHDMPEQGLEGTGFENWNGDAWRKYFLPGFEQQQESPVSEGGRVARKFGNFAAGGALAGPAGMLPAVTGTIGSEGGKLLDEAAPEFTKGYGEFAGGVGGGILGGVKQARTRVPDRSPAPSIDDLETGAKAAYQSAKDAGLVIKHEALQRTMTEIERELADFGYRPRNHPATAGALDEINGDLANGLPLTLEHMDGLRKAIKKGARPDNFEDIKASQKVVKNIDRMLSNLTPDDVIMGDSKAGVAALSKARDLWARKSKGELVAETLDKAVRQTQRAASGGNIDNAIRQRFDALLNRKAFKRLGFTADEEAMIRKVVSGRGNTQEALRFFGKMSPRGGAINMLMTLGGLGGASYVVPPAAPFLLGGAAVGAIARPIANAMTKGNVRMLSEAVRRGKVFKGGPKRMVSQGAPPKPTGRMLTKP